VGPSIGSYSWNYGFFVFGIIIVVFGVNGCETIRKVIVEFAPVLRKIDCTPATRNGREVWGIHWDIGFSVRRKESSGTKRTPALWGKLKIFLLVEADAE